MTIITDMTTHDIRFPTSRTLDGSDAMNADPDYSAAYVVLHTDQPDGPAGHGLTFTIGRGNEVCVAAIEAMRPLVVGQTLEDFAASPGAYWRTLTGDSQLRWIGPEKGAVHLATAAVINAWWDLYAKSRKLPLWRLICEMTPEQIADCVDFRYMTDALTRDEAVEMLDRLAGTRAERIAELERDGYPSYTTSAGWLGYSDDKMRSLCRDLKSRGWTIFKLKVGRDLEDDRRRCRILREEVGADARLLIDANQVWDVPQAIEWVRALAEFNPYFIEEPTSPDDVLGHQAIAKAVAPIRVATGEHCANRVMFKQFLQAGAMQVCQLDSCRLGGVNEVLAVQLLAAKFGIPVCAHAGGVGLCEYVQHLSMIDYVCISGSLEDRFTEYTDHLHEHFVDPVQMRDGRYVPSTLPGYSGEMTAESLQRFRFPDGPEWSDR